MIKTLKWVGGVDGYLEIIDQRKLPGEYKTLRCCNVKQLYDAIKTLAVRGAPAIGVAGAYGAVLSLKEFFQKDANRRARRTGRQKTEDGGQKSEDRRQMLEISAVSPEQGWLSHAVKLLKRDCEYLASSRPTAVNLRWAIDRVVKCAENRAGTLNELRKAVLKEANDICLEDIEMCRKIGANGARFVTRASSPWKHGQDGRATISVLTHCNAGALATAGQGTALSVLYEAKKRGKKFRVFVDETRPLLQGARLTAWELKRAKIDTTVICDNMAAALMRAGKIDMVITGADRIAANGDAANKTGTYGLSVLAKAHKIPFYIAAPSSTFDLKTKTGKDIPIEQRSADEIRFCGSKKMTPEGVDIYNPAFDVTPAENITAIITERGAIEKPNGRKIAKHFAWKS